MRLTPICVKCGREMYCAKNGVVIYHPIEFPSPGPVQEKVGDFTVVNTDRLFVDWWKKGG